MEVSQQTTSKLINLIITEVNFKGLGWVLNLFIVRLYQCYIYFRKYYNDNILKKIVRLCYF